MAVNLGDRVKDSVSGFSGIATSRTEFLNGCIRVGVEPEKLDKEGNVIDFKIFDEGQLVVKSKAAVRSKTRVTQPGGHRPHIGRAPDITR